MEGEKKLNEKNGLTILECLNNFGIARLTLDRAIKWRNEKFIFRELVQVSDVVHLAVWLHNSYTAVLRFLRVAAQVPIANVQTLLSGRKKESRIVSTKLPGNECLRSLN